MKYTKPKIHSLHMYNFHHKGSSLLSKWLKCISTKSNRNRKNIIITLFNFGLGILAAIKNRSTSTPNSLCFPHTFSTETGSIIDRKVMLSN